MRLWRTFNNWCCFIDCEMAENTPSWINSEFLEKALRFNGKHPDIEVISYEIAPAASASDHYGSVMYRVAVITSENGKTDTISVIVKCELQYDGLPEKEHMIGLYLLTLNAM
ncbi:hypothetical protein L9F63_024515 [Diploptera punctata]|uniref:Uncharacterized protein n=1 Tax=Diploptera punctata TaxID=6984 RepID=A0AAD7ZET1_DIPPU|nr:hypothetical protein L9F63_024515 [Diploptera punctata]